jgi:hypothetical protein
MNQSSIRTAWKQHYRSALDELKLAATEENVHLAEEALFVRWQELAGNPNHHSERNEMQRASDELLLVKTQKLGWPGITS